MHKIFQVTTPDLMLFLLPYTANARCTSLKGHLLLQAACESIKSDIRMFHGKDHEDSSAYQIY